MQNTNTENQPNRDRAKDASIDQLRAEAEQQRARVARDLDTLGRKVSPQNMKLEARQAVTEAKHSAASKVRHQVDEATARGQQAGSRAIGLVRENPVPIAMIGIGLGMLFYSSRNQHSTNGSSRHGNARRRGQELGAHLKQSAQERQGQARQALGEWTHGATEYGRKASHGARNFYEENPLAVAGATLVAGAALGLMLPRTAREDSLLGPRRAAVADKVKQYAEHGLESAQGAVHQATNKAAEQFERRAQTSR